MAEIAFYHLTRSPVENALPGLLAKTLAAGEKALVCCGKAGRQRLSTAIWSYADQSGEAGWLPHGMSGGDEADAAICPIWLTDDPADNPIDAGYVFFTDAIAPEIPASAVRVFILFDGRDDDAVGRARACWKDYKDGGHALRYLKQDEGGGWQEQKS